jgi:hypothetical protein
MFLCDPCHAKANCSMVGVDDVFAPRSHGKCESCGASATCIDCHNYGQAKRKAKSSPAKPYATTGTVTKLEPAKGAYQVNEIGWIKGDDGRTYQFSNFGIKTGPGWHRTIVAVGDRVSFEQIHVGGEGFLKYPLVNGLELTGSKAAQIVAPKSRKSTT